MKKLTCFLMFFVSLFCYSTELLDKLTERNVQNFEQENRLNEMNLRNSEILNFNPNINNQILENNEITENSKSFYIF